MSGGGAWGSDRLCASLHNQAIRVAGMMLVAMGRASYMRLASQGLLQGIGFLGGAVIFKTGTDVRGIKTAAAIWITGAIGLAIGTWFWRLGIIVGCATALILLISDLLPPRQPQVDASERSNSGLTGK